MAAGLLVLVGLGLFLAGVITGVTTLYWVCVGACVLAAVLLFLTRRSMRATSVEAVSGVREEASTGRHAGGSAPTAAAPAVASATPEQDTGSARVQQAAPPEAPASPAVADSVSTPATAASPVDAGGATSAAAESFPETGEPPVEEVEVTDLLLVVDLRDEVLVVDEHPRYHVTGCRQLVGRQTIPIPLDEARTDGFTPCGTCRPDATLADRVRAKK